jgi:hypothetical protein
MKRPLVQTLNGLDPGEDVAPGDLVKLVAG